MERLIRRCSPFLFACLLGLLLPANLLFGQEKKKEDDEPATRPAPKADPADFGLKTPEGTPKPGGGRLVLIKSPDEELVVAKTLVEVADQLVVMLPDGRLRMLPTLEATPTDRKFEPISMQDMAKKLVDKTFAGFKTRTTKNYVYIYNSSEMFCKGTSAILESMYPSLVSYCRRQKIPVHEPETPLVLILFRTQDEFDEFHPMPDGVVAYYNGVTNYVVMYEQSKLLDVAPDLAVKQAISTIAHEGVHQILHNIGVQQRLSDWPMWISEGLPEYFAPTTSKGARWKGVGKPNDLRMRSLQNYLKQGPGRNDMVGPTTSAEALTSTGYATSWALTHFLAERRKEKFYSYLREISGRGPLEKFTEQQNVEQFKKFFPEDTTKFDTQILQHLQKLPYEDPIENQTHYVVAVKTGVRRAYMITTSPKAIADWRNEVLSKQPTTQFIIQAFPNAATAKLFAKSMARAL
ncbi:MAG TPA: DUF1570 domain-containing protein [Pirellulales bacterium]|nr:DUF1570 domain-containing protein [Pirellulales bacterium]